MPQSSPLKRHVSIAAALAVLLLLGAAPGPAGTPAPPAAAPLIAVAVPAVPGAAAEPCADGAHLVRLEAGLPSPLAPGFDAACEPALDAAANRLYFAARRQAGGPWAVYELDLAASAATPARRLTPEDAGCRQPAPLPDGSVVAACGGDLYRVDPTGSADAAPGRLSASAGRLDAPAVLPDGRVMARLAEPDGGSLLLISLPDGTWATPWRDGEIPSLESFRPAPPSGLLLATPSEGPLEVASLADPFVDPRAVGPARGWQLRDPAPLSGGGVVASARPASGRSPFGLVRLSEDPGAQPVPLASVAGTHLLQPVPLESRSAPPVLPSIVKPTMTTGYLVLFDAARTDDPALRDLGQGLAPGLARGRFRAVRLFPWEEGAASPRAVDLTPAEDGSLFLEVPADRPLGMALVGAGGELLPATGGPFWVRPNERRACLGCHVSNRYAPPDVRPKALTGPARKIDWKTAAKSASAAADRQASDEEAP